VSAAGGAVRSWLFAPADRPDRCDKALASTADQVIWDLEDGVAAERRPDARLALAARLPALAGATRRPWIRVSAPDTADGERDLAMLRDLRWDGGLVVPKASAGSVARLPALAPQCASWLLIVETAAGMWDLSRDALRPPSGIAARLAFGALDYALDLSVSVTPGEPELLAARSQLVWLSRALGLPAPIDAVEARFDDPSAVSAAAARGHALGFAGKLAIHPSQIGPIHGAFAPTADEADWARRVLAAVEGGVGAARVDGAMVDRPVVERARAILAAEASATGAGPGR